MFSPFPSVYMYMAQNSIFNYNVVFYHNAYYFILTNTLHNLYRVLEFLP